MWDLRDISVKGGDLRNKVFRAFVEARALQGVKYRFFKRRNIIIIIILVVLAAAAIIYGRATNFEIGKNLSPQVDSVFLKIDRSHPDFMNATLYISIYNFFPFDVKLDSLAYRLSVDDTVFIYNKINQGQIVESYKRHQAVMPLVFNYNHLKKKLEESSKKKRGKGIQLDLYAYIEFPFIGQQRFHFGKARNIKVKQAPSLSLQSIDIVLEDDASETLQIDFYLDVERNLPRGSLVDSIEYVISLEDSPYVYGNKQHNIALHKLKKRGILLSADVKYKDLQQRIRNLQGRDSIWLTMRGYAGLIFPRNQDFNLRWEIDKKIVVPRPPTITLKSLNMNKFDMDTSELMVELKVINHNTFGLTFHQINYEFFIGRKMIANNVVKVEQRVDPNSVSILSVPVNLQSMRTGWSAMKMKIFGSEPKYTMVAKFKITSDIKEIGDVDLNVTARGRIKSNESSSDTTLKLVDILKELD